MPYGDRKDALANILASHSPSEVDTDPPPGFETELRYLFRPVPFAVRVYSLPDLLPIMI